MCFSNHLKRSTVNKVANSQQKSVNSRQLVANQLKSFQIVMVFFFFFLRPLGFPDIFAEIYLITFKFLYLTFLTTFPKSYLKKKVYLASSATIQGDYNG